MKSTRIFLLLIVLAGISSPGLVSAQTASFNFTQYPVSVSGWVNVHGNPAAQVCSGTDAGTGITVSSIATANWAPYTNGLSAYDSGGLSGGTFFPATVMLSHWFQYNPSFADFNAAIPQLKISGLNKDSLYTLKMTGSFGTAFDLNPTQYTVVGLREYGSIDVNNNNNTFRGAVFANIFPDATGSIYVYVNTVPSTQVADICGIQVIKGTIGTFPTVTITQPQANAGLSEDNTITIAGTATEAGGAIAQVQFFVDTTLIGTLTAPPYQVSWAGGDPGAHTIIASASDTNGNSNSASVGVLVQSLNFYWSTTGNIGNNGDSNFLGNVDSVRLDFRTKNIQRMSVTAIGNIGIGTISPTAQLHTTGSARLAGLPNDSTSVYPQALVSDANGNVAYRPAADLGQTAGGGLGIFGSNTLTLGDSVPGPGAHSFTSNRYQYLNGYFYSVGGSVDSPVNSPNFRWHNNGDLVSGTTMDRSVNTQAQTGLRYFNKMGILELGASDRLDTIRSRLVSGSWQGSGLLSNSDDSNSGGPKMINSIYMSDISHVDTSVTFITSLVALEDAQVIAPASLTNSLFVGYGQGISAPAVNSAMVGQSNTVSYPVSADFLGGFLNSTADTALYSLVAGANNVFGGPGQLTMGEILKNRAPYGTVLGNSNVDFPSLPYTGTRGVSVTGIAGYPLFAFGNSSSVSGSTSSNAITVLYNGRTQINTTGFTNALSQTAVTPKAALEVVSTNSGVLFPLLTDAQRSAITSTDLQTGLLLYNSDMGCYQFYTGSNWQPLGFSGNFSAEWQSLGNTGTSPSGNFVGTTDSKPLVFRTDNIQRMMIAVSGAVGMGTSTPQTNARLAVNGTIYAQKIEAIQTGWPDYVFEPGYSPMPLPNLQRYIQQHRRLPGVPSTKDAADSGVDLGDNQALLLRKVEELTLYLIEAHKNTEERQKEIDRLKAASGRLSDQQRELTALRAQLEQLINQKK